MFYESTSDGILRLALRLQHPHVVTALPGNGAYKRTYDIRGEERVYVDTSQQCVKNMAKEPIEMFSRAEGYE